MKNVRSNYMMMIWILIIVIIHSCSSNQTITTATWKTPEKLSSPYKNILLVGLMSDVAVRETLEGELEVRLYKLGITSQKSIKLFPPSLSNSNTIYKERIIESSKSNKNDAILTISLIDKETETRYVPGAYGYDPAFRYNWYGSFGGYYSYWSPHVYAPGYYMKEKIYFIEANVYDAKTEKLVWSSQSKTYDPADIESFSVSYSQSVVKDLLRDGIIKK
jgi:hypothetical protein